MLLCGNMRRVEQCKTHKHIRVQLQNVVSGEYTAMYILKRISQWLLTSL
jgi:hypothetical protein